MIDTDKYETMTQHDLIEILNHWEQLAFQKTNEVKQLREQLKEANDVIQYALEMSSDDDSTRVFEDYLEVIE